jgi:hypothetical protein
VSRERKDAAEKVELTRSWTANCAQRPVSRLMSRTKRPPLFWLIEARSEARPSAVLPGWRRAQLTPFTGMPRSRTGSSEADMGKA